VLKSRRLIWAGNGAGMRGEIILCRVLFGKLKEWDRWEETDVAGRVLLKRILNK
jgi:hypothetical protein